MKHPEPLLIGTRVRFIKSVFLIVPGFDQILVVAQENDSGEILGWAPDSCYIVRVKRHANPIVAEYRTDFVVDDAPGGEDEV